MSILVKHDSSDHGLLSSSTGLAQTSAELMSAKGRHSFSMFVITLYSSQLA
jgi:hypothetical protein